MKEICNLTTRFTQGIAYLKKSSFIKPLLHRHHFVISILPLICHNNCYPVSRYFCSCKFTFKCLLSFLQTSSNQMNHQGVNSSDLGHVVTLAIGQKDPPHVNKSPQLPQFTSQTTSHQHCHLCNFNFCLPATLPLAVDNPLQH